MIVKVRIKCPPPLQVILLTLMDTVLASDDSTFQQIKTKKKKKKSSLGEIVKIWMTRRSLFKSHMRNLVLYKYNQWHASHIIHKAALA